ncbi:transcription modulator/accessory protein [Novymonas esmeraldas]|uniref:Transcription modulator/accessory protein n=1 Tax=Novymonas esmeraldas TaxID=1808958 RepID=A0AAW0EJ41_9TRYP
MRLGSGGGVVGANSRQISSVGFLALWYCRSCLCKAPPQSCSLRSSPTAPASTSSSVWLQSRCWTPTSSTPAPAPAPPPAPLATLECTRRSVSAGAVRVCRTPCSPSLRRQCTPGSAAAASPNCISPARCPFNTVTVTAAAAAAAAFHSTRLLLGSGALRHAVREPRGAETDSTARRWGRTGLADMGTTAAGRKAETARKAPATTGKRKYTRKSATAAVVSEMLAAAAANTSARRASADEGRHDDVADDEPDEEVYNGQDELSPEETHRLTSERLLLPLRAVRYVLTQAKDGATVPFLARYRQGETGRMDETQLRLVMETAKEVTEVHRRRQFMLRSLESRGLLTPALRAAFGSMVHVSQLEDAWEPYKERRTSIASRGRAAGLGPYAVALLRFDPEDPACRARLDELGTVVRTTEDGERLLVAILAEDLQRGEEVRRRLGDYCRHTARLSCTMVTKPRKKAAKELHEESFEALRKHYAYYDNKSWSVQRIVAHIVLALQRGEAKGVLKVDMESGPKSHGLFMHAIREQHPALNLLLPPPSTPRAGAAGSSAHVFRDAGYARKILHDGIQAAYSHMMKQAHIAIRRDLKKSAEQEAIVVFAHNLHHMLLQRPLTRSRILAMDPGLSNGVKCVALDEHGAVETFFTCTLMDEHKMRRYITQIVESRRLNKIVIGNGTASGRTTDLVADLIKQQKWTEVEFAVVSEAGASVYSVSDIAKEEFPNLDVMYRGAVSIGRRVLDPLSELVKIPVRSMGIGMYQHDVNEKELMRELNYVLESCVAKVGINAASANRYVMEKVPGIQKRIVDQIVLARHAKRLHSRNDLRRVPAMTESVYEQVAGFFRFPNSPEPLDNSSIHPESYPIVRRLVALHAAGQLGGAGGGGGGSDSSVAVAREPAVGAAGGAAAAAAAGDARERQEIAQRLTSFAAAELATLAAEKLGCSVETLELVRQELLNPGLDPRASLPHAGLLRREVRDAKDLRPGQLLSGVVQSVTMFGAFVDCGLHESVLLRGEGVDGLQVGVYLDQRIRFTGLDHVKRPRVVLVRSTPTAGAAGDRGETPTRAAQPRRLRLEAEDVLGSDGRGFVSQAAPDTRLYDSLASNSSDGVTAISAAAAEAQTLTARVMQERRRRAEEALSKPGGAAVVEPVPAEADGARAATQRLSPSVTTVPQSLVKRARSQTEPDGDARRAQRQRVETAAVADPGPRAQQREKATAAVPVGNDAASPVTSGSPVPAVAVQSDGGSSTSMSTSESDDEVFSF